MIILTNPYADVADTSRIQTRIASSDHVYLTHLNPTPGKAFIEPLINTIYHKLITQLRKEKVHDYTDYERLVLILNRLNFDDHIQSRSGEAVAIPIGQGCVADVGVRIASTDNTMERNASVDTNTKTSVTKRDGRPRGADLIRKIKGKGELAK